MGFIVRDWEGILLLVMAAPKEASSQGCIGGGR